MRFTDRVIEEQRQYRLSKEREAENQQEENQEDETGMIYAPRPRFGFLNDQKGIFDNTDDHSINKAPSVFDRTAIFHVSNGDNE